MKKDQLIETHKHQLNKSATHSPSLHSPMPGQVLKGSWTFYCWINTYYTFKHPQCITDPSQEALQSFIIPY